MSNSVEKETVTQVAIEQPKNNVYNEKANNSSDIILPAYDNLDDVELNHVEADLNVTEGDLIEAKEFAKQLSLEETKNIMIQVLKIHEHDPNFPWQIVEKIKLFLGDPNVFETPEKHVDLIQEMKMEAALITNNSPYAEVRAVVDNFDDPKMPSSTIRAWVIGIFFVGVLAFINQFFSIRQPGISVTSNVAQLLCYPIGRLAAAVLPDVGFTLFGTRHSLNPGPFSRKEHMLITIMANVGYLTPYTDNIIWSQYLPQYFNQPYAGQFAYQILVAFATNFIGYGIAGMCRRFLVYPTYCVWPASLVTIALNSAFHTETNVSVLSPFKKVWNISRLKFFLVTFAAMFVYFWFPNYLFEALTYFSWMSWIAPNNVNLNTITGFQNGLGLNPWPTFDWNVLLWDLQDPLMVPFFNILNRFIGCFIFMFLVIGLYYSNTYHTSFIPINDNHVYDRFGQLYNVSRAINEKGLFDAEKYEAYSPAYLSAGNLTTYFAFFAIYAATISYTYLYHRHEIMMGFRNIINSFKKNKDPTRKGEYTDIHNRLMSVYEEVPEWWYTICLVGAVACGCAGLTAWDTYTSVGVVFYGIALCLVFVIPIGIINAITGIEVTLNVLAEFIGGSWVAGNALAMNYFKSFGYVTCAHALRFSNDLKLAHYIKIPPKHTFFAQMIATVVSTFVCTAILNFQMNEIEGVCTKTQPDRFTCPGINTFFTAAVLWGTLGPHKIFGKGGQYTAMLVGFPVGLIAPFIFYYAQKNFPKQRWLRQVHPVILMYGGITWAPYNLSYVWPAVPIGWLSMVWCKKRYLAFWSKYNYILSASFSAGIAIAAIVIFFSLQWSKVSVEWWGNEVPYKGCEGSACTRMTLGEDEWFGPGIGGFN